MMEKTSKRSGLRALLRLICFAIVFIALLIALNFRFYDDRYESAAWKYAQSEQAKPIDVLFVGNSHAFRTFDAQTISQALDINARVLSCLSSNGNIITSSLEAFVTCNTPDVVVLEVNPYLVSNYTHMREAKVGIVYQHFDSIKNPMQRLEALLKTVNPEDVPAGWLQILRGGDKWSRWSARAERSADSKEDAYGYFGLDTYKQDISYDAKMLEEFYGDTSVSDDEHPLFHGNVDAIERVLALAEKYDFEVWFVFAPVSQISKEYANGFREIVRLCENNERVTHFDNLMTRLTQMRIEPRDFYDGGHLCRTGAEKATQYMIDLIAERRGLKKDYSNVLRYKDESVTSIGNGLYRHQMECYCDALYRFIYTNEYNEEIVTQWSEQNWIDLIPLQQSNVAVEMTPVDGNGEILRCGFMPFSVQDFNLTIYTDGFRISDETDYGSLDVSYAWYIKNLATQITQKHMYSTDNSLNVELLESGDYTIQCYTRFLPSDKRVAIIVATVRYDAQAGTVSVIKALDNVTVIP